MSGKLFLLSVLGFENSTKLQGIHTYWFKAKFVQFKLHSSGKCLPDTVDWLHTNTGNTFSRTEHGTC